MLSNKMRALLPTIGFILVAVIVSMMVLNYFNINMNDNSGLRVLNRSAVFEGMSNCQQQEGMENEEKEEKEEKEEEGLTDMSVKDFVSDSF